MTTALRRLGVVMACAATVFAAGCSNSTTTGSTNPPKIEPASAVGAGEGQLNLVAWPGYAEDGSNDPKVDWVHPFEQESGCKVNIKIGNTSDEMVQLMRTTQYDGVSASGDATLRLIAGGDAGPELLGEIRGNIEAAETGRLGVGNVRRDRLLPQRGGVEKLLGELVIAALEDGIDHDPHDLAKPVPPRFHLSQAAIFQSNTIHVRHLERTRGRPLKSSGQKLPHRHPLVRVAQTDKPHRRLFGPKFPQLWADNRSTISHERQRIRIHS